MWKESIFPCHFLLFRIMEYRHQPMIDPWYICTYLICLNTLPWLSDGPRELGLHQNINRKRLFDRCLSRNRFFRIIDRAIHKECPHYSKFRALERLC
jgi:hypothetical protein